MKLLLLLAATQLTATLLTTNQASSAAPSIHLIDVQGTINPGSASYILESVKAAEREKAEALLIRLNTPGGLLSSTRDIIQGFSQATVPVILYVSPGGASATSAGALLTLASHLAVLAPGTNIGAAHPVGSGGEDVKGTMGEKVTNDTAALARSQATLRGRNAANAELVVTKSKSFSPEEAVQAGIVDFVASDLQDLLQKAEGRKIRIGAQEKILRTKGAEVLPRSMSLMQKFLHFIADPNISTMLLALGALAFYVEVSSGFTLIAPAVVGALSILLGAISLQMLPINTGGLLLIALGFIFLLAEIFVTSYGLLAVAGLASLFFGGLFLIDPAGGSMQVSLGLLGSLLAGMGVVMGFVAYLLARDRGRVSVADQVVGAMATVKSTGADGRQGHALVNGELWAFEAKDPLQPQENAQVVGLRGIRLQLEKRSH